MFRNGDILVIYEPKHHGAVIGTHPFIVTNSEGGQIRKDSHGEAFYDFAAVIMTSMTTPEREAKAQKYFSNFIVRPEDKKVKQVKHVTLSQKPAYAVLNQTFFFSVEETRIKRIGRLTDEAHESLMERMDQMAEKHIPMQFVYDNIKTKEQFMEIDEERDF